MGIDYTIRHRKLIAEMTDEQLKVAIENWTIAMQENAEEMKQVEEAGRELAALVSLCHRENRKRIEGVDVGSGPCVNFFHD